MQLLQLSPEATEALQHVLHAGFKIPLHLDESTQRPHPIREECVKLIRPKKPDDTYAGCRASPLLQVVADELHFVRQYRVLVRLLWCRF